MTAIMVNSSIILFFKLTTTKSVSENFCHMKKKKPTHMNDKNPYKYFLYYRPAGGF
jgi:hypothetical protein